MKFLSLLCAILLMGAALPVEAHGGRTNSQGCHNKRSNNTYHCHR